MQEKVAEVPHQARFAQLTPRELQVYALICDGYTNIEIADQLHISKRTVETHISRIFVKLKVVSRAEAIVLYYSISDVFEEDVR